MARMCKILTAQPEAGSLRQDSEVKKYFVDGDGKVWEWIGTCTGPKIQFLSKEGKQETHQIESGGKVLRKVKWISPVGNPLPMDDREFISLLKNPALGERWRTEESPKVDSEFLKKFYSLRPDKSLRRRGCNTKVYAPAEEMDFRNKGLTCGWCGSICEWHGTAVKGSIAEKAFKAAQVKRKAEKAKASEG